MSPSADAHDGIPWCGRAGRRRARDRRAGRGGARDLRAGRRRARDRRTAPYTHAFSPAVVWRPAHLSEHPKAWQSQVHVALPQPDGTSRCPSLMGHLGVAVLGVAVLGTAVLHRTLTHSFSPALVWRPARLSEHPKAWQSQVHVALPQPDGIPWCGRAGRGRARDRCAATRTAHSAQPWFAPHVSKGALHSMQLQAQFTMAQATFDTLVWPC